MFGPGGWQQLAETAWAAFQAPLLAALALAAAGLLGRGLGARWLVAGATGGALCVGWVAVAHGLTFWPVSSALWPTSPAQRLALLALAAWGLGMGAEAVRWPGAAAGAAFVLGCGAAWWLAGAPTTDAGMGLVLAPIGCLVLAMLLALRILRRSASPWPALTAALALAGGVAAAGLGAAWPNLALVLAVAAIGGFVGGEGSGWRLPMAAGLVGLAGGVVLSFGGLGRGAFTRADLAGLLCLPAIWVQARLRGRMAPRKRGGRFWPGEVAAAGGAALLATGGVWLGGQLGLR